jgi:hypothetical protein
MVHPRRRWSSKHTDGSRLLLPQWHNPRDHDLTTSPSAGIDLRIPCCNRTIHELRPFIFGPISYTPQNPSHCIDQSGHICLVCSSHVAPHSRFFLLSSSSFRRPVLLPPVLEPPFHSHIRLTLSSFLFSVFRVASYPVLSPARP